MRGKNILAVLLVTVLFLGLTALAKPDKPDNPNKPDKAGPADKLTGSITIIANDGKTAVADFNAHEPKGDRPAKGMFHWKHETGREVAVLVKYVNVGGADGKSAWFAGRCVKVFGIPNSYIDRWFVVQAYDGGTPAANGDRIWWQWLGKEPADEDDAKDMVEQGMTPANEKSIVAGNLVVHTYE